MRSQATTPVRNIIETKLRIDCGGYDESMDHCISRLMMITQNRSDGGGDSVRYMALFLVTLSCIVLYLNVCI